MVDCPPHVNVAEYRGCDLDVEWALVTVGATTDCIEGAFYIHDFIFFVLTDSNDPRVALDLCLHLVDVREHDPASGSG